MSKITQCVDFISVTQKVIDNCELNKKLSPLNITTTWKVITTPNESFVMHESASSHYYMGLGYITDELKNKVEVSEGFLDNHYTEFIRDQMLSGGDLSVNCKRFLNELKTLQLKQFKILLPVCNYNYRGDVDLEKVRIIMLDDQLLKKEFDYNVDMTNTGWLTYVNHTEIYAIVKIDSVEKEHAKDLAFRLAQRFVYATKLFEPNSFVCLRRPGVDPVQESLLVMYDTKPDHINTTHNLVVNNIPGPNFYAEMQPYWDKLSKFLYTDVPNDLEQTILSVLYWYGEANVHVDSRVKLFSNLITGLEWLVLHPYGESRYKSDKFGKNCSIILHGNKRHKKFWKKYYQKRNCLAHQELVDIYQNEIDTLRICLRKILLQLITFTKNYTNLKDVFIKEFKIDVNSERSSQS